MEKNIVKPKTLPGFMELLPDEQILFNEMKEKIQKSYEKFGFLPLDTPIIESADVLLAKAGGETEKQIYKFSKLIKTEGLCPTPCDFLKKIE